jgi:hypothetical protein
MLRVAILTWIQIGAINTFISSACDKILIFTTIKAIATLYYNYNNKYIMGYFKMVSFFYRDFTITILKQYNQTS